jgi:hypothetical protein
MQQEMCFSCQLFKIATLHDKIMHIPESVAHLQVVTQARPGIPISVLKHFFVL